MNQFQSIGEVLSALRRRSVLILSITFVGCMLSVYFALQQEKSYEATAVVQIEDARVPDRLAGATAASEDASRRVRLIEQRLMARDNLMRIMDKHDLFSDNPDMTLNERVYAMRLAARIKPVTNPQQSFSPEGNAPSGLIITVSLNDPDKAAELANELMTSVIDQSRDRSSDRARETVEFFRGEEARVGAEIEKLDTRIAAFKRENGEQLPSGLTDLRSQLSSLRDTDLDLDQQILTLETATDRTREEVKTRQIALLREQKALIAERVNQIETLISGAPDVERALNGLEREMTKLQEQYEVITRRLAEAELGQMLENRQATDRFEVLETALPPVYPASGSRKKIAMLGGIASLMVGVALAFVVELMNPAIRTAAQMERALGVQPVVAIPVVNTPRDRRIGGLRTLGKLALVAALIAAGLRLIWDRVPVLAELSGKLLPRAIRH